MTEAEVRKIYDDYITHRDVRATEIFEKYNCKADNMHCLFWKYGLRSRRYNPLHRQIHIEENIPKERALEIYEQYVNGTTLVELSKKFGMGKYTIKGLFRINNLEYPIPLAVRHKNVISKERVLEIYARYMNGASIDELGKKFKMGRRTIENLFEFNGLKYPIQLTMRRKNGALNGENNTYALSKEAVQSAYEEYAKGVSLIKIAKQYFCSDNTLINLFMIYGFKYPIGCKIRSKYNHAIHKRSNARANI